MKDNLAAYMERDGYTVIQVAEACEVKRGTVYNWLKGTVSPHEQSVLKMCALFRCEPWELRYNVELGSPTRVQDAAEGVLQEMDRLGLSLPPPKMGRLIALIYEELGKKDGRTRPADIQKII